jgi:NAD(P)-dependent dehydrogenase (short-subunit alcohol dehydrogenase family)
MGQPGTETAEKLQQRPPQHQPKPGRESRMVPHPLVDDPEYKAAGKLRDKVALITGGDSGIGRAVAVIYAKEGADVAIAYLSEHEDARETQHMVEKQGRRCLLMAGDLGNEAFCREVVQKTVDTFGKLDILVNNHGAHWEAENIETQDMALMEKTFRTNVFSFFYLAKAAVPHLKDGSAIINTTSVTAYKGSGHLLDYSATKGAIETFTYSLSEQLISRGIRVNAVAPGPIWTPLIVSSFSPEHVRQFGSDTPMGRAGQPAEVATCYVFLASHDSSYMSGQILHPNGGRIVHG